MVKELIIQFDNHDRRIFWSFVVIALTMVLLYVYFLSISVYAVVVRKSAEAEGMVLSEQIAGLQSEYALLDKAIDLALARERGFSDIQVPTYLSAEKGTGNLSLRKDVRIGEDPQ